MADIFISYASEDRPGVEPLARAIEDRGWSVWWDRKIPPGKTFSQVIEEALSAAKCVIVIWSNASVKSDWVQNEAAEGARRSILVPALFDDVQIPFEFRRIQAADLIDWKAETDHPGFTILIGAISEIVGPSQLKVKKAEEKRAHEERIREQEVKTEIKPDKPEPVEVRPPETESDAKPTNETITSEQASPKSPKTSNTLKLGILAAVAVLLMVGIWQWFSQPQTETSVAVKPGEALAKGTEYYNAAKYGMALPLFQQSAKQGSGEAMTYLGYMYEAGLGVKRDYAEAVRWYRKAADAGDATGMANLGYMYQMGRGVTGDYTEAARWYRKAADAGDTRAMANLGHMYRDGSGIKRDYAEAVRWYRKAANAGNAAGMSSLGGMYRDGFGVTKDYNAAVSWYRKAADAGDDYAIKRLNELGEKR